ncbi:hypothetical protein N7530_000292 [Penicillium desertorum]|uniref:Uncharacterized protein n=1 Tax=Penicillium desertorum TaxID=1303715 RepID=A0A9W9X818_9EURO|nr:hypothetical protein N7530_000292 [Penicillium desertorum]
MHGFWVWRTAGVYLLLNCSSLLLSRSVMQGGVVHPLQIDLTLAPILTESLGEASGALQS